MRNNTQIGCRLNDGELAHLAHVAGQLGLGNAAFMRRSVYLAMAVGYESHAQHYRRLADELLRSSEPTGEPAAQRDAAI